MSVVTSLKSPPGHADIVELLIPGLQFGEVDQRFSETLPAHWAGGSSPAVTLTSWWGLFLLVLGEECLVSSLKNTLDVRHTAVGHFDSCPVDDFVQRMLGRKVEVDEL